jgi:hypothetical protein
MVEVVHTDEFGEWFLGLDKDDQEAVVHVVGLLEARGIRLEYPYSSSLKGTKHPLRELRKQSRGKPLRIIYAFDPRRQAVLLIGGDKTGEDSFYKWVIPLSERIWEQYLKEQKQGLHE